MDIVQVSVLGGLLALDGTSVGQFMVSRPLVAGALAGWVLGEPSLGFALGAILELYLLVSFPTGGSRFPEGATATVVAVAAAAGSDAPGALPLAVAAGLVWGQIAGVSITLLRRVNARLVPDPEGGPAGTSRLAAGHLGAVLLDFARGAAVTLFGALVASPLVRTLGPSWPLPESATLGLMLVGGAVSVGILLRDFGGFRRRRAALATGLVLGILGATLL